MPPHSSLSSSAAAAAAETSTSTDEEQPPPREGEDTLRATLRDLPGPVASALADELLLCGAFSASVDEYRAPGTAEQKIFGARGGDGESEGNGDSAAVLWDRCTLTAIFDPAADVPAALREASLAAGIDRSSLPEPELSEARASEWLDALRGAFSPVFVEGRAGGEGGRGLWILPEGCSLPRQEEAGEGASRSPAPAYSFSSSGDKDDEKPAVVVRLTPGLAFGTGGHSTTRMCLQWLATEEVVLALRARGGRSGRSASGRSGTGGEAKQQGASLLDFGTGSGVLAAAAIALGCRSAVGTDIDPLALTAAAENAALNSDPTTTATAEAPPLLRTVLVRRDPEPEQASKIAEESDPVGPPGSFDVVVANILQGPLLRLAPALVRWAAPGAPLAVSGILASQAHDVAAAFREAGVELTEFARERCGDGREEEASGGEEGWWVCLSGRKRL